MTQDFDRLAKTNIDARTAEARKNLANENAIDLEDKNREKIKVFKYWFKHLIDKSYFDNDGSQNYIIFRPVF